MKKVLLAMLIAAMMSNGVVFAENDLAVDTEIQAEQALEEAPAGEETAEVQATQTLSISISMVPRTKVVDSVAVIELYTKNGEKIGTSEEWIGGITESLELKFDVPSLAAGDTYILKLKSGLTYLKYYDKMYGVDEGIELTAYGYLNEAGEALVANSFALDACPLFEHAIVMYVRGNQLELYPDARLLNNTAMVPLMPVAEAMGLDVRYDEAYNSVVCEIGDKQAIFNVGTAYATIFGQDTFLPVNCEVIDDTIYLPVRPLAESFGCEVETFDFGDHIDVCLGESSVVAEYMSQFPVNQWGLSSRTKYLVWIDKSDYAVRVYTGSKGNWRQIKHFTCAIGAPGSPTPTGSYEYQYRMTQWDYPGYYVGPCLVFYGNYAMHSTLLRYDGTPYDNRVGVMISHGCVRLRKPDIDWLSANLPTGSRVYITE